MTGVNVARRVAASYAGEPLTSASLLSRSVMVIDDGVTGSLKVAVTVRRRRDPGGAGGGLPVGHGRLGGVAGARRENDIDPVVGGGKASRREAGGAVLVNTVGSVSAVLQRGERPVAGRRA